MGGHARPPGGLEGLALDIESIRREPVDRAEVRDGPGLARASRACEAQVAPVDVGVDEVAVVDVDGSNS